ncbi:MAG: phosphopyruvate hydratase [Clostridia bacterium]|nr:phosphopyruvate hydratase [Clostridia bacterium]
MAKISSLKAFEILDSRGTPTVECEVLLSDGTRGMASVPSGASTGIHEACELRDGDTERYGGRGVLSAVKNVNSTISEILVGKDALDQNNIDSIMISYDGSINKSKLGANAILSASFAVCDAAARSLGISLYRYLGGIVSDKRLPTPMMNVLNGGAHAKNNIDIQEFMIVPRGDVALSDAVRMCAEVYSALKRLLSEKGLSVGLGDEGGFAPDLRSDEEALEMLCSATELAGYRVGVDFSYAIDVAASEWQSEDGYFLPKRRVKFTREELVDYIASLVKKYPIISVEDGMGEDDTEGWKMLTDRLKPKGVTLVGDDLFATNKERLSMGINEGIASAILLKPNQIGTVSETIDAATLAKRSGYKTVMSHRSGETECTIISDLAVALSADYVKFGAPCRSERTAKYNRLIKIEDEIRGYKL